MKKFLSLVLCLLLALLFVGCSTPDDGESSSDLPTSEPDTQSTTPYILFSDPTKNIPHNDVSADKLTNNQAREILEALIPKQTAVFELFQLDSQKIDETQIMPGNAWYVLCTDERFSCVQDIKDYILQVYTGNQAKWYFDVYLDCEPTTVDINFGCYYLDYDGKLYRNTTAGGKGLNFNEHLMNTTRIVARTESTVAVEIDTKDKDGFPQIIYKFLLCETQNGWRLDSPFLDSYYPS